MSARHISSKQYISIVVHLILVNIVVSSPLEIGNATCEFAILDGGQALFCVNVGLTEIGGFPDTVKYINRLNMGENYITNLPTGVFDVFNYLLFLDLNDNRINNIEKGAFDSLGNLYVLNLMKNRLTSLDIEVFDKLANLLILYLDHNYLSHLEPGLFDSTPALKSLWMHKIQLENLTVGIFDSLTRLTKLDLSGNPFRYLPKGIFDSLISLQELFLSEVGFTTLESGDFELPWLHDLRLHDGEIERIGQGTFDSLPSLVTLNLRGNKLTSLVPGLFDTLFQLESLELNRNPITTIDGKLFTNFKKLRVFWLPLPCNCSSNKLSLMDYVNSNSGVVFIFNYTFTDRTTEWLEATENCSSTWISMRECFKLSTTTETGMTEFQTTMPTNSQTSEDHKPIERTESSFTTEGKIYSAIAGVTGLAISISTFLMIRKKRNHGTVTEIHKRTEQFDQSNVEVMELENLEFDVSPPENDEKKCHGAQPPVNHMDRVTYLDRETKEDMV